MGAPSCFVLPLWHTPPRACAHQLVLDLCAGVFTELSLQWASLCPFLRLVKFQPLVTWSFWWAVPSWSCWGPHPNVALRYFSINSSVMEGVIMKDKRQYCHLEIPGILVALYQEPRRKTKNLFLLQWKCQKFYLLYLFIYMFIFLFHFFKLAFHSVCLLLIFDTSFIIWLRNTSFAKDACY